MKKTSLTIILIFSMLSALFAQEITLTEIPSRKFEGVKEIEGVGYYTFYFDAKAKKGFRDFTIAMYDYDLNEINTTKINLPKHVVLVDGVANKENLLMAFIDAKKKKVTYMTFDFEGNKVKQRLDEVKNKLILTDVRYRPKLFAGEDNSFFVVKVIKEKRYGYQVEKLDNNLKSLWTESYTPQKGIIMPIDAVNENGVLAITSLKYPTLMSRKFDTNLSVFETSEGDHLFDTKINSESVYPVPSSVTIDNDGGIVLGGMYYEGSKVRNKNSDGVFLLKFNQDGTENFFKTTDWDNGLQAQLKASTKKELLSSKPMVLFHDIESTDTGYRVIGETFRKSVDKLQSALSIAGGGGVNLKFSILDFAIFNFDKKGEVEGFDIISKEPRNVDMEAVFGDNSAMLTNNMVIARALKRYGYFGYRFTTQDAEGDDAIVYFNSPGGTIKLKVRPYYAIAKLSDPDNPIKYELRGEDRKFSKGSLNRIGVLDNNEGGKLLLYNYDRSEKTLTVWIEKY